MCVFEGAARFLLISVCEWMNCNYKHQASQVNYFIPQQQVWQLLCLPNHAPYVYCHGFIQGKFVVKFGLSYIENVHCCYEILTCMLQLLRLQLLQ